MQKQKTSRLKQSILLNLNNVIINPDSFRDKKQVNNENIN